MSVDKQEYGHRVTIGDHQVLSWGAMTGPDGECVSDVCVQVSFGNVQVMLYRSVRDGQIVVDVDTFEAETPSAPRVYVNDSVVLNDLVVPEVQA